MRAMRAKRLAFAFVLAVAGNALSQDESHPNPTWQDMMAKGIVPYHQLTVDDFLVNDKAHPEANFYIQATILPRYHFILKPHSGFAFATVDQWMVFSGVDKNATSRKSKFKAMKEALPYAQAILDLNEIHARQIAALKPGELPEVRGNSFEEARTQLTVKLNAFLEVKYKESKAETEAFIKATDHNANRKKVRTLAAKIRKRLEATPNTTVPFTDTPAPGSSPFATPVPLPNVSPATGATPIRSPSP
jgi:hypothetical protein